MRSIKTNLKFHTSGVSVNIGVHTSLFLNSQKLCLHFCTHSNFEFILVKFNNESANFESSSTKATIIAGYTKKATNFCYCSKEFLLLLPSPPTSLYFYYFYFLLKKRLNGSHKKPLRQLTIE